jgi:hypothetical protein
MFEHVARVTLDEPWAVAPTETAAERLREREIASATKGKPTLTDQVAALFRSRPSEWIDMQTLARVGGIGGWRTRVSDLRRAPYDMNIENENHREALDPDGRNWVTVSRYRYMPGQESQ